MTKLCGMFQREESTFVVYFFDYSFDCTFCPEWVDILRLLEEVLKTFAQEASFVTLGNTIMASGVFFHCVGGTTKARLLSFICSCGCLSCTKETCVHNYKPYRLSFQLCVTDLRGLNQADGW